MKEPKFFGTLLPSHPAFIPIVRSLREKYNLLEINPDDDPIHEIYLGDEIVPLEEFRREIEYRIRENLDFMPPDFLGLYTNAKKYFGQPFNMNGFESLSDENKNAIQKVFELAQNMMGFYVKIGDAQIKSIADMLYVYLLTGEEEEMPNDWMGKVVTVANNDQTIIMAMANQLSNPDAIVQQFRDAYKKSFGAYRPKITKIVVSTAYYMQLRRMGKPFNFLVEEYIRRNKFSLPRDRASKRYFDIYNKHEKTLRKRIQRTEKILNILVEDKK
jgi:hypothetical protein